MIKEVEELKAEIKRLKQENELKTGWISLLSHDFKEIFGNIMWLTEGIENESISKEDYFKLLPRITQDAKKSLQTVNDTSTWLKTQMNNFEPQSIALVAQDLFFQLKETFEVELKAKEIDLLYKGDESVTFKNDPFLVFFILKKLVNNAIKFSDSGKRIHFEIDRKNEDVVLSIVDYGMGMNLETKKSLFSFEGPIFQGTNGEVGAGLSLKIVRKFVSLMQGEIEVVSTENVGTKISIMLPDKTK
ncbi:sensor histidine kinase [Arenibacter certesii]|uniref:histidine kinase n=1 Tax=Arenibacter certesii TaxID=228955 RepID=A0A918MKA8_9FLAO|nr:HAMP domain-containing sensor histidine kinase [Arenibacter certesii]GGW30176.1 hypothetical protein GCM10007383_14310 [Arenibacter certesii]